MSDRSKLRAVTLTVLVLLAYGLVACAPTYSGPTRPRMEIRVTNQFRDPVDVRVYCDGAQVGIARWIMRGSAEVLRVAAGPTCRLRVRIVPSVTGGPFTASEYYDSGQGLHSAGDCAVLTLTANPILAASFTLPARCA